MYRNCVYNNKEKCIHLFTWDADGRRVQYDLDFKPYLLVEDKNGTEKSIFGTNLKKREFNTLWDRNTFVKDGNMKRTFENLPPNQQFLIDNYWMDNENEDFSQYPLKIMFIDIETFSKDGFPDVETVPHVINVITCHDSLTDTYNTFGLGNFDISKITTSSPIFGKKIKYTACKSEEELLKKFINYFTSDYPDVISGWNSSGFDFPYIINRITHILGEEWVKELSPIGRYYEKNKKVVKFGEPPKVYIVEGVSSIDYMVIYQKFAMEKQESYKLGHIGEQELGEAKIDYDGQLWELAQNDWQKFVEYNIQDVKLLVKLDDKLRYIELLRFLAYTGLSTMDKAIDTLPIVNGSIAVKARFRGERIPTFIRPMKLEKNPGGFVAEPNLGRSEWIVSFDANSLYPSVMITLNLSPETKVGRVEKIMDKIVVHHVSGRQFEYTPENFAKIFRAEEWAISENKFLFSQKRKGIMPEFLDELYTKRKEMKKKMIEVKKKLKEEGEDLSDEEKNELKVLIQRYDTFQFAYKINLNSVYGYMGNPYAPMGDDDIASAVTLTGQAVIHQSKEIFMEFLKNKYPGLSQRELDKTYIYSDTDSDYFTLKVLENHGIILKNDDGTVHDGFYSLCDEIENNMNDGMTVWAKKKYKSKDPRFIFKRESICDDGIFVGGKNYVLHVLDSEGIKTNEYKYKGVAVVKSTMPRVIKPYVKNIIEDILTTKKLKSANELFDEAYEAFKKLTPSEIAKIQQMNNYEKHGSKSDGFNTAKGMTGHVKAAHYYNVMLDKLGLTGKYEKFKSGEKVKQVELVTPNSYGIDRIGFKDKFPPEFAEIFKIDYEKSFVKVLFAPIETFYDSVGWVLRKPNENVRVELDDIFGL